MLRTAYVVGALTLSGTPRAVGCAVGVRCSKTAAEHARTNTQVDGGWNWAGSNSLLLLLLLLGTVQPGAAQRLLVTYGSS